MHMESEPLSTFNYVDPRFGVGWREFTNSNLFNKLFLLLEKNPNNLGIVIYGITIIKILIV